LNIVILKLNESGISNISNQICDMYLCLSF
jgi:hypothetical protein